MSFLGKRSAFLLVVVAAILVSCGSNRKPEPDIGQYQNHGDGGTAEIKPEYTIGYFFQQPAGKDSDQNQLCTQELMEKQQRDLKK